MIPDPNEPAKVDVSLSEGVTIHWKDGHVSHYAILKLREACPCATCNDLHGTGQPKPQPQPVLPIYTPNGSRLESAKPVGRYAVNFTFSDGHNTGIFTWEYLRGLCTCELCRRDAASGVRQK